jgi:hypothetical protein
MACQKHESRHCKGEGRSSWSGHPAAIRAAGQSARSHGLEVSHGIIRLGLRYVEVGWGPKVGNSSLIRSSFARSHGLGVSHGIIRLGLEYVKVPKVGNSILMKCIACMCVLQTHVVDGLSARSCDVYGM